MTPDIVLQFWRDAGPERWYRKDAAFDNDFRLKFEEAHFAAARRAHDPWQDTPEGMLALLILLDQFPRNCYRGTAHQFATDPLARHFAYAAIARGDASHVEDDLRQFFFLPLMHSESLSDQDRLLILVADQPQTLKFAHIHRDIIVKFGRFPHRNAALGRETTPEEQLFLNAGGFSG